MGLAESWIIGQQAQQNENDRWDAASALSRQRTESDHALRMANIATKKANEKVAELERVLKHYKFTEKSQNEYFKGVFSVEGSNLSDTKKVEEFMKLVWQHKDECHESYYDLEDDLEG